MADPQTENGYTKIANEILEELGKTYLSPYEWQITMILFRKTYGFSKKEDHIANSQFVELTGLHKAHVSRTIKKLKNKNIVTQIGNRISFNKDYSSWLPKQATVKTFKKLPKQATEVTQIGNNSYPNRRTQKKKETIQKKEYSQLSDLQETDLQEIALRYKVELEFVKDKFDDMELWAGNNKNKTKGRNWKLTLMKWVKKDSIGKQAKDYSNLTIQELNQAVSDCLSLNQPIDELVSELRKRGKL